MADSQRWFLVSDGQILGSVNANEARRIASILREVDVPFVAEFFERIAQSAAEV